MSHRSILGVPWSIVIADSLISLLTADRHLKLDDQNAPEIG
jgi:hypothetical protein